MPRAFAHRWLLLASAQLCSLEISNAALVLPDSSQPHLAASGLGRVKTLLRRRQSE
jgi:hypothetical protein